MTTGQTLAQVAGLAAFALAVALAFAVRAAVVRISATRRRRAAVQWTDDSTWLTEIRPPIPDGTPGRRRLILPPGGQRRRPPPVSRTPAEPEPGGHTS